MDATSYPSNQKLYESSLLISCIYLVSMLFGTFYFEVVSYGLMNCVKT